VEPAFETFETSALARSFVEDAVGVTRARRIDRALEDELLVGLLRERVLHLHLLAVLRRRRVPPEPIAGPAVALAVVEAALRISAVSYEPAQHARVTPHFLRRHRMRVLLRRLLLELHADPT